MVTRLSDLYTTSRAGLSREQVSPAHLAAKCEYFLASDAPKVGFALDEAASRSALFRQLANQSIVRVIDFGAGVGSTSVGFLAWLASVRAGNGKTQSSVKVELHAIELGAPAARVFERSVRVAAEHCGIELSLRVEARDFFECQAPEADLILSQTALNELLVEDRHASRTLTLVHAWSKAAPLLIIEPALKGTTRALMQLRDSLLSLGGMRVVAPCLHQASCPMLSRAGDWCHEARHTERTPRVAAIDQLVTRRDHRALFAYLATEPGSAITPFTPSSAPLTMRICTETLGSRGKSERLVCRSDGEMRMLRLLDREMSASNAPFLNAARGEVIEIDPLPPNDRIAVDAQVTIVPLTITCSPETRRHTES